MKTNISIFGVLLFFAISNADAQYYYSDNRQIALNVDSSKILILFSEDPFQFDDFIQGYPRIDSVKAAFGQDGFKVTEINSGTNLDQFLDSLLADPRVSLANPYFINSQDSALMVGRTICCKFGDNVSYDFIDSLNNEYDIEIVYENDITPKQFLLSVKDNAEYSTLEIANIYYELEETEFSHPNFLGGLEAGNTPFQGVRDGLGQCDICRRR